MVEGESNLSHVFGLMESYKVELGISTYQVSQTKMEQIFVSLAQQQEDPDLPLDNDRSLLSGLLSSCCRRIVPAGDGACCRCCRRRTPELLTQSIEEDEISSLSILI